MKLRETGKRFLPPIVVDAVRWMKTVSGNSLSHKYEPEEIIPWSHGYNVYKSGAIVAALADEPLLMRFRHGEALPPGYGVGVDERCIEYPWSVSRLDNGPEVLLDAGSTLNHDFILDHAIFRKKQLHILTLRPEARCFWQKGISYFFCDLRDIPIRDCYYDAIVCMSTLEHVGCDNTLYTGDDLYYKKDRIEDYIVAMGELARVVKPGGRLFLTVPFGVYRHFGFFQQFDRMLLQRAIEAFGAAREVSMSFYRYGKEGWNVANQADCLECEYWSWISRPRGEWPDPLPVEPDLATGARAVACVKFVK